MSTSSLRFVTLRTTFGNQELRKVIETAAQTRNTILKLFDRPQMQEEFGRWTKAEDLASIVKKEIIVVGRRRYVPASEYCASVRDGTHDSPKPTEKGRKLVTSKHLTTGNLDLSNAYLISEEDFENINKRSSVDTWDVLISMIGTVGVPCLIKEETDFAIKNLGLFKTKGEIDGRWLYYYLRSSEAQESIREQSRGSTQQYIPLASLRDLPVLVPHDREEQRAIVHILSTLDDKIELHRQMNKTLEDMARALFKSWFVDFDPVRAKAALRTPPADGSQWTVARAGAYLERMANSVADLFPDQLVDSELGEIPEGWSVGMLGDMLQQRVERCSVSRETESLPYVPIDCISPKSLFLTESKPGTEAKSSLTKFHADDLIFGAMRPYFHKVCIAPFDGTTRTTAFVLYPKRSKNLAFATLLLHDSKTIDFATRNSTGSTIPYAVWTDSLEAMPIVSPPPSVLTAFDDAMRPFLLHIPKSFFESRTLGVTRDALLSKLVSGDLRLDLLHGEHT
ncbi:MAG: restriction endonuclease subunit S [Gemmatimonadota bacterium]|nr:restriction endonuclease subunit S [Gemmatimonadota bacterium]